MRKYPGIAPSREKPTLRHDFESCFSTTVKTFRNLLPLNQFMSWCAFLLVGVQIIFVINIISSVFFGKKAPDNPWNANTLEWAAPPRAS